MKLTKYISNKLDELYAEYNCGAISYLDYIKEESRLLGINRSVNLTNK